jgi:hypothetical protein
MASPFLGVYTAVYGYTAQNSGEINFEEGDLLCVLEKPVDDDWWKAKKKGNSVDDEEPVGLIPNNYVKEVCRSCISWSPVQYHYQGSILI